MTFDQEKASLDLGRELHCTTELDRRSVITVRFTQFTDFGAKTNSQYEMSFADFAQRVRDAPIYETKKACPLISLATYGSVALADSGSFKHSGNLVEINGVALDYDGELVTIEEGARQLKESGVAAILHTTGRHSPERPRWRALLPLSTPHAPAELQMLVALANGAIGGIAASESASPAQGFYLGRVRNVPYECVVVEGQTIDRMSLFITPICPKGSHKQATPVNENSANLLTLNMREKPPLGIIAAAAAAIPNDGIHPQALTDWEEWRDIMFAIKDGAGEAGREIALEFSKLHPKFEQRQFDDRWKRSKSKPGGIGVGTLLARAQRCGWVDPRRVTDDEIASALDVQLARMLAKKLDGMFVYEHGGRKWMRYEAGRYVACARSEEVEVAKALGPNIARTALAEVEGFKTAMTLAMRMQTVSGIKAALMLAQSDPKLAVSSAQFDKDPDLLNVVNGVIHLPTQTLQPHTPSQFLSHQCPVRYDPNAKAPVFDKFMQEISKDDPEWIDYLQRAIGYTLSGRVGEEKIFFMLGNGANGKSVFCNVIRKVLGAYSIGLPANFLMASNKSDGEAATPALARLPGVRMAQFNEIEAGARLSAQTVKLVTATDAVSARRLYGDFFDFVPSHTPWVRANHRPIIVDNDEGIWRRIVLIPFDRHFSDDEKDVGLEEKIMAEAAGVLAWMVRGHAAYLARGLKLAARIAAASAGYRKESDLVGQWIDECTVRHVAAEWNKVFAFNDYRLWCSEQGLHTMTLTSFTRALKERGIDSAQRMKIGDRSRVYIGITAACDNIFQ